MYKRLRQLHTKTCIEFWFDNIIQYPTKLHRNTVDKIDIKAPKPFPLLFYQVYDRKSVGVIKMSLQT